MLTLILTLILGLSHKSSFSIEDKVYAQSYVDNFYFPYYEVQLDVRDDNSFLVTERVTVHYYQAYEEDGRLVGRHKGWVRALPTWANVSRVVGDDTKPTKTYYEFDISNLKCTQGKLYDHYTDENYYYIEFGGNNYVNIDGDYEESKALWQEVLSLDKNSQLAYNGLAKALYVEGEYKQAMEYAKLGIDKETYGQAFKWVRRDYIKDNFIWIFYNVCS